MTGMMCQIKAVYLPNLSKSQTKSFGGHKHRRPFGMDPLGKLTILSVVPHTSKGYNIEKMQGMMAE